MGSRSLLRLPIPRPSSTTTKFSARKKKNHMAPADHPRPITLRRKNFADAPTDGGRRLPASRRASWHARGMGRNAPYVHRCRALPDRFRRVSTRLIRRNRHLHGQRKCGSSLTSTTYDQGRPPLPGSATRTIYWLVGDSRSPGTRRQPVQSNPFKRVRFVGRAPRSRTDVKSGLATICVICRGLETP